MSTDNLDPEDIAFIAESIERFCHALISAGQESDHLQAALTSVAGALRLATDIQGKGGLKPIDCQPLTELTTALLGLQKGREIPIWLRQSKGANRRAKELNEMSKRAYAAAAVDLYMMTGLQVEEACKKVADVIKINWQELRRYREKFKSGTFKNAEIAENNYHKYIEAGKDDPKNAATACMQLLKDLYIDRLTL